MSDKTELPTVNANPERCNNCRFWDCMFLDTPTQSLAQVLTDSVAEGTAAGYCHRFPPPFTKKVDSPDSWSDSFPRTTPDAWCGEWQAKKPADAVSDRSNIVIRCEAMTYDELLDEVIRQRQATKIAFKILTAKRKERPKPNE